MVNYLPDRREQKLESKLRDWVDKLFDLSRRNNLLYFNDPNQQRSILLNDGGEIQIRRLIAGETTRLTDLFTAERLPAALTRIKKINSKAIENYEERSIETLTLAIGILDWAEEGESETQRSPRAPILLADLQIKKVKGRGDYEILMTPESLRLNQALRYKLQRDFGIDISLGSETDGLMTGSQRFDSFRTSHVPDASELAGDATKNDDELLGELESDPRERIRKVLIPQVTGIRGVSVDADHLMLGNFSSSRLAMIQDLEASRSDLIKHDFVMAMADDSEAKSRIRGEIGEIDPAAPNKIAPADEFLILDADASQNEVINAIVSGKSFAFDGPPGTGKSQTIANSIATLVARGKRVLFVAEKRAAIDAVMSRLDKNGLGDLVMDFHATSQRKREFLKKLRDTSEAARRALATVAPLAADELVNTRKHLIERTEALHEMRPELGISLYELLKIAHRQPNFDSEEKISFSQKTLREMSHESVCRVKEKLRTYTDHGGFRESHGARLWRSCELSLPNEIEDFSDSLDDWGDSEIDEIRDSLASFASDLQIPGASPSTTAEAFAIVTDLCVFASDYSWATLRINLVEAKDILNEGQFSVRLRAKSRQKLAELRKVIGKKVKLREATTLLDRGSDLQGRWHELTKNAPIPLAKPARFDEIKISIERYRRVCRELGAVPELAVAMSNLSDPATQIIADLKRERLVSSGLPAIREIEKSLQENGIWKIIERVQSSCNDKEQIGNRVEEAWARAQIEAIMNKDRRLVSADSSNTRSLNARFAEADAQHLLNTPARIRAIWARRFEEAAKTCPAEHAILMQTFHQVRNLPTVRQLFEKTKDVLCILKPCWVTSPLSVSTFRPPSKWFDVVIFDEASQIKPVHAITSIKAARQVVVAGDEEQLPPTDFFADDGGDSGSDDGTDKTDGTIRLDLSDIRSLLGATKAIVTRPRQLQWHYRSRDERLIGFSNDRIYHKSLVTFPHSHSTTPISQVLVEQFPENVTTRATNRAEVRQVVELVKSHISANPSESLGVIALGKPHADAIIDALEKERENDSNLSDYLDVASLEPFFVKNLERVQGDERDAIILSIGYGRRDDGSLSYAFGPVNGDDGYKRLNVATTRAKSRMTVVSTFRGEEMVESRCQGGTLFLRDYLVYASSGGQILVRTENALDPLNPFEKSIQYALEANGLKLVPQHGVGRFRIDFAVRHPSDPKRFALAVECDGASYHSYPTARDRDRLRQNILESRGWKFHRIWSTDWFRNPEDELQKVMKSYQDAIQD